MSRIGRGPLISLLAVAVALLVSAAYLAFGVANYRPFAESARFTVALDNAAGLIPRSPVMLSGVRIGKVTAVDNIPTGGVTVHFDTEKKHRIPVDSTLRVENLSGLVEAFMDFRPRTGTGPYLRAGDQVASTRVAPPSTITELAETATRLLEQVNTQQLASIVNTFTAGLDGTRDTLTRLARSTDLLAAVLLARTDVLRQLFVNVQAPVGDMAWAKTALSSGAESWSTFGPKIDQMINAIGEVAKQGNVPDDYVTGWGLIPLIDKLNVWIAATGPDVRSLAPALKPLVDASTAVAGRVDISQLIADGLGAVGDGDALHFQIRLR
jgi:virulence factor Mce-like protein